MSLLNLEDRVRYRRIYTTFILGTAHLNLGTGANNIGHGTLDFYRVKANFSARVPKNLGGPRPPQEVVSARLKRGPRAETRGNLFPRVFALTTLPRKRRLWGRKWAFGRQNSCTFRVKKDGLEKFEELWHNSHLMEHRCHRHVNRRKLSSSR